MKNVETKITTSDEIRAFLAKCGSKGGSVSTEKKTAAARKNGLAPCRPGKFRGRPRGSIKPWKQE